MQLTSASYQNIQCIMFSSTCSMVKKLIPWLNNIALRTPMSLVLIVGTHRDEIPNHEKKETVDNLLHQTTELAAAFQNKLKIAKMFVGLKNRLLCITELKAISVLQNTQVGQQARGSWDSRFHLVIMHWTNIFKASRRRYEVVPANPSCARKSSCLLSASSTSLT